MTAAVHTLPAHTARRPGDLTPDDLRALPVVPEGPRVVITWKPPFHIEQQVIFAMGAVTPDGAAGVEAEHVIKALCRALDCWPGALSFEGDPKARHLRGDDARCYLLNAAGGRIAAIQGISFAWLQVDAARLTNRGWTPARNREAGAVIADPRPLTQTLSQTR